MHVFRDAGKYTLSGYVLPELHIKLEEDLKRINDTKSCSGMNISTTTKSYVAVSNAQKQQKHWQLEDDVTKKYCKEVEKGEEIRFFLAEILGLK